MSALHGHVADYLRLRRALGFKLDRAGYELPRFASWLEANGIETVTAQAAIEWARLPQDAQPIYRAQRLGTVRGFARYLRTIDPATEIPRRGCSVSSNATTPTSTRRPRSGGCCEQHASCPIRCWRHRSRRCWVCWLPATPSPGVSWRVGLRLASFPFAHKLIL